MIVVMRPDHTPAQVQAVMDRLVQFGLQGQPIQGVEREVIAGLGQVQQEHRDEIAMMAGVDEVIRVTRPYKLSSREVHPKSTIIELPHGVLVGGGHPVFMAGPCAVESEDQVMAAARGVRAAGAHVLRGGAFKPRSSPYSFQGLGLEALKLLRQAGDEVGLPIITECLSVRDIDVCTQYTDVIQIGARNMQNFVLLQEAGKTGKPVLLKRGFSATIEEWLLASEYIMSQNNPNVMLCERGIRTFETATRNTLDLNAVALVRRLSHLPVIADPSHGTGKWYLVRPMSMASLAAGADGLMIEVHPNPDHALSDGAQSLTPANFGELANDARRLAEALGRSFAEAPAARASALTVVSESHAESHEDAPAAVTPALEAPEAIEPPAPEASDAFSFDLPAFEGPLDLLLHLIEREELDITEVSLLSVTEQYLRHLRSQEQINLGALAEFIAIGARLLLLKSRALLPREDQPIVEDEDEGNDIRALVEALKEYRRFKQAAEFFRDRDGTSGTYRRSAPPPKVPLPTGLESVTLSSLVDVIRDIMERIPEEDPVGEVRREPVRLRDRITRLVDRLEVEQRTSFRRLVEGAGSRTEVIVDFMAVLELIKQRYLEAVQSESFGDIDLVRLEGAIAPLFGASNGAELDEDFSGA